MGFLDNIGKSLSQGYDRAKFEAEKLQKVTRIQGEVADVRKQIDARRTELGDRTFELYKAGQIQSATLSELVQAIDSLRNSLAIKEDELKAAQNERPPDAAMGVQTQQVPISTATAPMGSGPTRACPNCGFQLPTSAMFCPNCGTRMTS